MFNVPLDTKLETLFAASFLAGYSAEKTKTNPGEITSNYTISLG